MKQICIFRLKRTKQLLEFIKKHDTEYKFVNVIQTALEMNENTIGETYVRWVIDDITNEYEMRYGKPPKKG